MKIVILDIVNMKLSLNSETEIFMPNSMVFANCWQGKNNVHILINHDIKQWVGNGVNVRQIKDGSSIVFKPSYPRTMSGIEAMKIKNKNFQIGYQLIKTHTKNGIIFIDKFVLYEISIVSSLI